MPRVPFQSLKKFSIKRSECPGPSTSNATTGNNAWSRGTRPLPLQPCPKHEDGVMGRLYTPKKTIPSCPIMDVGLKGGPFRIRGCRRRLIYELVRCFSGFFHIHGIRKAASLVSRIHFCLFCNFPPTRFTRLKRLSTICALSPVPFSRSSLGSFDPRVDALISLRPSWNSGCRPNKVWRDR